MAHNLFSFNPFQGVQSGIRPRVNHYDVRKLRISPPHIACGAEFVQIDRSWKAALQVDLLLEGELRMVKPAQGRPFEVFNMRTPQSTSLYVLAELSTPPGVKAKFSANDIGALTKVKLSGKARLVLHDRPEGHAFIEFKEDGDSADIWAASGAIYRLSRTGETVVHEPLSLFEMITLRVDQFDGQIAQLKLESNPDDVRRFHGIIVSAIRLVQYAPDEATTDALVDFLLEHIGSHFIPRLREMIREVLLEKDHPKSSWFTPGYETPLLEPRPSFARRKPTAKKAARSARDRELREQMRGSSGGGKQQAKARK